MVVLPEASSSSSFAGSLTSSSNGSRDDRVSTSASAIVKEEITADDETEPTTSAAQNHNAEFLPDLSDDEDMEDDNAGTSSEGETSSDEGSWSGASGETSEVLSFTSARDETTGEVIIDPAAKEDNFLFCDVCNDWIEGSCLEHINFLENDEECIRELPAGFSFNVSRWRDDQTGVFTAHPLPKGLMMGPLKSRSVEDFVGKSISEIDYIWEVKLYNGKSMYVMRDEGEGSECNWLGSVVFTNSREAQNVLALQFNGEVYYKTLREVSAGAELLCYRGEGLAWTKNIPKETLIAAAQAKNSVEYEVYCCSHCPGEFRNLKRLHVHLRSYRHNPPDDVCCRKCPYVAPKRSHLRRHAFTKHQDKPFRCPFCQNRYKTPRHQQEHITRVHSSGRPRKAHKCKVCGKAFRILNHLRNHLATHREKAFECSNCGLRLASETNLKQHIETRHSDITHPCPHCGKEHQSKQAMKKHVKHYHTPRGLQAKMQKREEILKKKQAQKEEAAQKREENRKCRFCDSVLASSSARLRHERRRHMDDVLELELSEGKPRDGWTCKICGKVIKTKPEWKNHLARHNGEMPFTCPKCDKGYITKSELNKHLTRSVTCSVKI